MENCSVKQYRTAVNNPDLEYFDALQIKFDPTVSGGPTSVRCVSSIEGEKKPSLGGAGVKIKVLSNGTIDTYFQTGLLEYVITGEETRDVSVVATDTAKPCEFLLIGLNKITKMYRDAYKGVYMKNPMKQASCSNLLPYGGTTLFNFPPYKDGDVVDVSQFYSSYLHKADVTVIRRTAEDARIKTLCSTDSLSGYTSLTSIDSYLGVKYGDVASLATLTSLTALNFNVATGDTTNVMGDISSIGSLTSLTTLDLGSTKIQGTLESFVAAQCTSGRTTASDISVYGNAYVTYIPAGSSEPILLSKSKQLVSWNKVGDDYNITVVAA